MRDRTLEIKIAKIPNHYIGTCLKLLGQYYCHRPPEFKQIGSNFKAFSSFANDARITSHSPLGSIYFTTSPGSIASKSQRICPSLPTRSITANSASFTTFCARSPSGRQSQHMEC